MRDLMIDLEYLAQGDDAVITQVAAVPFDIVTGEHTGHRCDDYFDCHVQIQGQLDGGRVIDADTMLWWMGQIAANGEPEWTHQHEAEPLEDCLEAFTDWFETRYDKDSCRIFSHVGYDVGKLLSAYRGNEMVFPFIPRGRNAYHLQTLRQLAKLKAVDAGDEEFIFTIDEYRAEKTHNAVDDCVAQIKYATACWKYLGLA